MDSDRIKGKADDIAGRVKRQVGEWTGDTETQAEGAAQQVKGKVENAWGRPRTPSAMLLTTPSVASIRTMTLATSIAKIGTWPNPAPISFLRAPNWRPLFCARVVAQSPD